MRSLVFDLKGADPGVSSWTFAMHVEAVVDDLPPIPNTGGDVSRNAASWWVWCDGSANRSSLAIGVRKQLH